MHTLAGHWPEHSRNLCCVKNLQLLLLLFRIFVLLPNYMVIYVTTLGFLFPTGFFSGSCPVSSPPSRISFSNYPKQFKSFSKFLSLIIAVPEIRHSRHTNPIRNDPNVLMNLFALLLFAFPPSNPSSDKLIALITSAQSGPTTINHHNGYPKKNLWTRDFQTQSYFPG